MATRHRSTLVITISSLVIASVLALTTFGFYAYLEWKTTAIRKSYALATHDFNSKLFNKYVIANLQAGLGTKGAFKGKPIVEGTIKNTSNKKIYSLGLKITFSDPDGEVVCMDMIYPLSSEFGTKSFLLEGDSISFRHQLKNPPPEIFEHLKSKLKFAKTKSAKPLELVYKISSMDIR